MADVSVTLAPGQQFPVSVTDQLTTVGTSAPLTNIEVAIASVAGINATVSGNAERIVTVSGGGGIPDAPNDGKSYMRNSQAWVTLAPSNSVAPTISGLPVLAATLTVSTGTWAYSPASYSYQWQQSTTGTSDWSDISGETSSSLTLGSPFYNTKTLL
jgi:hypothetical protein